MEKDKTEQIHTEVKAKITSSTYVHIRSTKKDEPIGAPLYAINWFNTKSLWLYNFYNLVASRSVTSVGGNPFFKGTVQEVLWGNDSSKRDVLLIVKYPDAIQFKKMLETLYFKFVSILRILAVNRFTFGFTVPTELNSLPSKSNQKKIYAIHHYKADKDITEEVKQAIEDQNVEILYAGRISALLFSGNAEKADQQVPCLMSGMFLLSADSVEDYQNLIKTQDYQSIIQQTDFSFVATLKRTL